jgi:hypothetical protein
VFRSSSKLLLAQPSWAAGPAAISVGERETERGELTTKTKSKLLEVETQRR